MFHKVFVAILLLLSSLLAPSARASIMYTITPTSTTIANIKVTGNDSATQGSFSAATPAQRAARIALLSTGADGSPTSLYSSQGSTAPWTLQSALPGASTLLTSSGGILTLTAASVGPFTGGQNKIIVPVTVNPVAGNTISGEITGLTLPSGFTWGAIGATGPLFYGQNNSGNVITNTGTWIIAAPAPTVPEPSTFALAGLGLLGLGCLALRKKFRRA